MRSSCGECFSWQQIKLVNRIWMMSSQTKIAYLTVEEAEETVESIPGIAESIIGQHDDFAAHALIGLK